MSASPPPFRLAVTDLDDTLFGPDKTISPGNLEAIRRLQQAGVEIALASGRQYLNILSIAQQYDLPGWIISSQGAFVQHSVSQEILCDQRVNPTLGREILQRGTAQDLSLLVYHPRGVFSDAASPWIELYAKRAGRAPEIAPLEPLVQEGAHKVLWTSAAERMDQLATQAEEAYQGRLYVVHTEREMLEFCAPEVNKAAAIATVAARLGIPVGEVATFGDGNNDVPMLRWSGFSVAMHHGRESARLAAKLVTPPGPPETAFARGVGMLLGEG